MKKIICLWVSAGFITSAQAVVVSEPQSLNAMPVKTNQLRWQAVSHGHLPSNAIVAAENKSGPVYICHAKEHKGIHPGMVTPQGCVVTYGGKQIVHKDYEVLTGDAKQLAWKDGRSWMSSYYMNQQFIGVEPAGSNYHYFDKAVLPVIGGYEYPLVYDANRQPIGPVVLDGQKDAPPMPQYAPQPRLLYICRTLMGNDIHIGKVVDNGCNVAVAGKEQSTHYFQTLCFHLGRVQ